VQLGQVIKDILTKELSPGFQVLTWRHLDIAISRRHLPEVCQFKRDYSLEEGNTAMDLQAAHTLKRASCTYARDKTAGPWSSSMLTPEFRALSRGWHAFLGFGGVQLLPRGKSVIGRKGVEGIRAHPSSSRAELVAEADDGHWLTSRAPPVAGSLVIPLSKDSNHNTWTGYQIKPGLTGISVPDQVVRDTAYLTYQSVKDKLPSTGLVSVIYVPWGGWAAGTIWQGSDEGFESFARRAEAFWQSVTAEDQKLDRELNGVHKWHAEAVAAVKAEEKFGEAMDGGTWPAGTKIYTYGHSWENKMHKSWG
jgi:hypothetical protein